MRVWGDRRGTREPKRGEGSKRTAMATRYFAQDPTELRLSVSAVVRREPGASEILLMRRSDNGLWGLPGGYVGASQLRQHGRIPGAIQSLRAVLKEQPRNTTTMADLAELYIAAGQLQPARALLERAHRMTPKNRRVREAREWLAEVGGGEPGGLPAPDGEPG